MKYVLDLQSDYNEDVTITWNVNKVYSEWMSECNFVKYKQ